VDPATPSRLKLPVPTSKAKALAPVLFPIVVLCPTAFVPIFIAPEPDSSTTEVAPVPFPTVIVLAPAVPILILFESASLPIPITPAELFNSRTPSASRRSVSSELIVISPDPVEAN
jgi:hypothetical protein